LFNRTYQIRARRQKLQGEQLDITFPRRGRPTKHRVLERCGQLQLALNGQIKLTPAAATEPAPTLARPAETLEDALQMTFPNQPLSEEQLWHEFLRLFPVEA